MHFIVIFLLHLKIIITIKTTNYFRAHLCLFCKVEPKCQWCGGTRLSAILNKYSFKYRNNGLGSIWTGRHGQIAKSQTIVCVQVKPVCLALSLLHSFYNITPPSFPLRFTGRFSLCTWSIRATKNKQNKKKRMQRKKKIFKKNTHTHTTVAVRRDLSAGNKRPGEEDKGGKAHAVV